MKPCGRCGELRTQQDFTPSAWLSSSPTWCKPCHRKYQRGWKQRNPERYKAHYMKSNHRRLATKRADVYADNTRRRGDLKRAAFAALGNVCACCGESDPTFLQIDHIANDGAAHRRSLDAREHSRAREGRASAQYRLYAAVRDGKTDGLQLLCANCNWGKARNRGTCPHEEVRVARLVVCS